MAAGILVTTLGLNTAMKSALATSSSSVLPFKSVLRFCSDCFVNLARSFSTVPQVRVVLPLIPWFGIRGAGLRFVSLPLGLMLIMRLFLALLVS